MPRLSRSAGPLLRRLAAAAGTALLLVGLGPALPAERVQPAGAASRPFAGDSPFNTALPGRPALDPASRAMVARLTRDGQAYANLYEFGIPIYGVSATTPRYRVSCAMAGAWGVCPLSAAPMPIPVSATPNSGEDGVLVVVDRVQGTVGEYWQARRTRTGWTASWGAVNQLNGSGWGGSSTGAGASRLAGVIRVSEIRRRSIPHALVLQSDNVCAGRVRPPALKTDGRSLRADCIPEGARVQLDPAVDLSAIRGLTPAERAVARALQVYGAYVIDRSGAALSISFERPPDASASSVGAAYRDAGLRWDYDGLPHIPWHRLRVLRTWQG